MCIPAKLWNLVLFIRFFLLTNENIFYILYSYLKLSTMNDRGIVYLIEASLKREVG